ncbi:fatty acid cis/trans isomerase [Sulfurimonas sp.]|uniref:fatty acid cis/trans isomerase n=1 Tax=Sulfurimonas sp. TaxID=2022749 RepID=UPI003D10C068
MNQLFLILFITLFFDACSLPPVEPVQVNKEQKNISFSQNVKPLLDKRCVVCHSCYNSPCQAKLSSYEGIDRGASKIEVYNATRLSAQEPTRLFIDAKTTQEWREKEFFSLTQNLEDVNGTFNDAIMLHLLYNKQVHPDIIGDYDPEHDKLICPRDKEELSEYFDKKTNHGMPYGFPALKEKEYTTLASWIFQGAKNDKTTTASISSKAQAQINQWENFLNRDDAKHQVTARYLYEHLYLAHIYFPSAKGEFFELVRSYTPSLQPIDVIPTLRPFDDPKTDKFYYRFRKITSTIVHKTHMVVKFDESVLARYNELFIQSKWRETPHEVSYNPKIATNPFVAFKQIPTRSRYQFLLDNSRYIVMTFIRGPVCRGQMALNVIHDHFWVMFRDPEYDIAVVDPAFIDTQVDNLSLPIEKVDNDLLKTFSDDYRQKYEAYYKAKKQRGVELFKNGYPIESIYKGMKSSDSPVLTIYRHFDSASVSRGVLGEEPRTMWVIDYAQFERIYYTLVAGYDVFGNVSHQTNIRRYMDFLRLEGEINFLEYMPKDARLDMLKSWYINDNIVDDAKYEAVDKIATNISYKTANYKDEFIRKIINEYLPKDLGYSFDRMNYKTKQDLANIKMKTKLKTAEDYIQAARSITLPGSGFVRYMTDRGANNMLLRVELEDGRYITKNLVINRWHDNVNSLFLEEMTLDATKDTMDILDKFVGSYPNVFIVLKFSELENFLKLMKNTTGSEADKEQLKHYFISRSNPKFWEYYDWFQKEFDRQQGVEAGLYDLNRYARTPW